MTFSLVVAMSRGGVIGRQGGLPWRLPRDLKRFRHLTWANRSSWAARPTRPWAGPCRSGPTSSSPGKAISRRKVALSPGPRNRRSRWPGRRTCPEVMIIGGSEIYRAFLPLCDTIHLTVVKSEFAGDVTFPEKLLDSPEWEKIHEEEWPADARNPHDASYVVLRRR